jgi:type I restriction enzyme S subunit
MSHTWPLVPLGELLRRSEESTEIEPDQQYKQVTVRLWGGGVILRRLVSGAEIAAEKQNIVRPQQFILSRIDARNGAFGLVPAFLDGAVVSNDFPSFEVNTQRLDSRFLEWMSKTSSFIGLCRAASEGTTNRVRLKIARLLATTVRLPPLTEQQRIAELADKIDAIRKLQAEAAAELDTLLAITLDHAFQGAL